MSVPATLQIVPTPQTDFFAEIPHQLRSFAHEIIGLIPTPADQPRFSMVILNLCSAVLKFAEEEPHLGNADEQLIQQCRELIAFANRKCELDQTAFGQIEGRLGEYPEWALCMQLDPVQLGISVPLGAEVWLSILERRKLRKDYVSHLRRDLDKLPTPGALTEARASDLTAMGFGKYWQRTFESIRNRLSKKLATKAAQPLQIKTPLSAPADEHLRHILGVKGNTTAKKRAALLTRNNLTSEQFKHYSVDLRGRLRSRQTGALCEALSMLTGLYPRGVMGLALADGPQAGEVLVIDVKGGYLLVTLSAILNRKTLKQDLPTIYESTQDHYRVPMPMEVLEPLRDLLAHGDARHAGPDFRLRLIDILPQPDRDYQAAHGESAIENPGVSAPGSVPTAARARNTLANEAIHAGVPRLHLAFARLDFGMVSKARPWYVRVQARPFEEQWMEFLEAQGWTVTSTVECAGGAFGSPYVLTDAALKLLWAFYQGRVDAIPKGNHMGIERLRLFHNAYVDQTAAILSWLMGLRETTHYDLSAQSLSGAVDFTHIDDKGTSALGSRLGVVCEFAASTLSNWQAHCESLLARLTRDRVFSATTQGRHIIKRLHGIVEGQDVGLLFKIAPNGIRVVSSKSTWGCLPPVLRCEANSGRHYWSTALHVAGYEEAAIDVFLRHINAGTSPTSAFSNQSIANIVRTISARQDSKLADLGFTPPVGLRVAR